MQNDDIKNFLQSRTVWSLIVSLLAMILAGTNFGKAISDTAVQATMVDTILQVVAGVFTLLGIFFRVKATTKLAV